MKFTINGRTWDSELLMHLSFNRERPGGLWTVGHSSGSAGGTVPALVEVEPGVFRSATKAEQQAEQDWWDDLRKRYGADEKPKGGAA